MLNCMKIAIILTIKSIFLSWNLLNSLNLSSNLNLGFSFSLSSVFSLFFLLLFDFLFLTFLFRFLLFFGCFLWLLFFLIGKEISAHKWLKNFRNSQTFFSLIVFKNATKGTLSSAKSTIKHMNISLLSILN